MALFTVPGPQLYAASTICQSPNIPYKYFTYLQAAFVDSNGSFLSSVYESWFSPNIFPVGYINCHNPPAPLLDTAIGFRADSTMAKYLNSIGKLYLSNSSSNIGKYK